MIAKRLRLIVVVTLALSMSILALNSPTYAQTTEQASALGQESVRVLEGNWQTLAPGAEHWYRFDYAGGDLPIRISMDVTSAESAAFQLWTAAQFSQLVANQDVAPLAVSTLDSDDPTHVVWEGTLGASGTYYIVAQPTTDTATQYLLNVGGRGLAPATDGGAIVSGAQNVNVRRGPSTAYSVIRTVPQGTQLTVLGEDATGTWLSVRLPDGREGWIARFLTNFTEDVPTVAAPALTALPLAPPATTATAAPDLGATANVNVRRGPSTAYSVIDTVPQGTQFTVLGQDATGTWLAVRFADGTEGWVARFLTDFSTTVPVIAAPALSQPPLAPPSAITTDAVVTTGAANVNVRTGPSTTYPVIDTVPNGTPLTVLGQDATTTWLSVRLHDDTQGWIARFLTNFTGDVSIVAAPALTAQTLTQPPLAPPPAITTDAAFVTDAANMNIRSGPSTTYPVLRTVPQGTQFTVLGQDATGTWLAVRFADGTEGWVARFLTDVTANLPVIAAPAITAPALTQPPLAPPSTITVVPGVASLPSEAASIDNYPIEQALDNNWRTLSAGQTQWFTFSHPGDKEPVQIWMAVEPNNAAGFRIYREEDAQAIMDGANPEDFLEIGSGTANPNEPGDLFWRGAFEEHGRYYVMVDGSATSSVTYSIYGVGPTIGD